MNSLTRFSLSIISLVFLFLSPARADSIADAERLAEGNRLYFLGELEQAVDAYAKVPRASRLYGAARLNRAVLLRQMGKSQEALSDFRRCEERGPRDAFLWNQMGWIYFSREYYGRSIYYFRRALESSPDDLEGSLGLGWSLARDNRIGDALAVYQRILSRHGEMAAAHYLAGRLFERMKKPESALTFYENAARRDTFLVEAKLARAHLLARQGMASGAVSMYRRLLRVLPGSRLVLRSLRLLSDMEAEKWIKQKTEEKLRQEVFTQQFDKTPKSPPAPFLQRRVPMLRVGLGVDARGRPLPRESLTFTCGSGFDLMDGKTLETIRAGKSGKDGETWTVRISSDPANPRLYSLVNGKSRVAHARSLVVAPHNRSATLTLKRMNYGGGSPFANETTRTYRGVLEIHRVATGLRVVNQVSLENYLASVVPSEMTGSAPLDALKAQAVLARCNAVALRPHKEMGYDVCDDQHCQAYAGVRVEIPRARRAVEETRGEVLTFHGKTAHTVYSSNCGGHTQYCAELTGWGDVPYWEGVLESSGIAAPDSPVAIEKWIRSVPDVYCRPAPRVDPAESRWMRVVEADYLQERLEEVHPGLGRVKAIVPLRRSRSGHVNAVEVRGSRRKVVIDREHLIRNLLAPGSLRSTLFVVQTVQEAGRPGYFVFWGGGWGHGVGLCQSGAVGLSTKGLKYKSILEHYFPACRLGKLQE